MNKIYSLDKLKSIIAQNPSQWRPLVFTNGCFDLLHVGHIRYLREAKEQGKTLIVGVNGDRSVVQIKPKRPIIPEAQRAELLGALGSVDGVVIFYETTATKVIETLQPDIYVKGGDYNVETLPESPAVFAYGGKIKLVDIEIPTSTTKIINKILDINK
ncbi:adenylyltransferase/cytidyltransferase family protein [Cyanobacterium stanieri LEGE 03274]|uniref:Adenylyltransferase/cytidyltransferase family protein n=1 Tax=Cyanobacterium stanieri LEGE 03274 TaxID=1828756 RepID=A0ABR9V5J3_9CHRO|nr:adenylyltransferase/cytidyltransferase family protein [Cyanobacterium stanieri]MBE9223132.1 adenylyltransferase/cytidyltransferase family protein [Cyanobacterium stanieri LEGE 03274]